MSTSIRGRLQKAGLKNRGGDSGGALSVVLEMMAPFAIRDAGDLLYVCGSEEMGL